MNPFRSTYTRFHKKLLTKTMAIGVLLALMGTACLLMIVASGAQAAPPVTVNVPVDSAYYSYIEKLSAIG